MPNFVESIGYASGKVHVGLIAYLCHLFQEGRPDPLVALLEGLDVSLPSEPVAAREWNSVDLAILDASTKDPHVLIEMKVDDHEHNARGTGKPQTVAYAEKFPEAAAYLYITLGMGEFYGPPKGNQFRWVRIRKFLAALDTIRTSDRVVNDWRDAVKHEVDRQDQVSRLDSTQVQEYRTGAWNIYVLGFLKESIETWLTEASLDLPLDCTCYPYGRAPDTILNFGWANAPAYMEITNDGRLRLKLNLEHLQTDEGKRRELSAMIEDVERRYPQGAYELHPGGKIGKSKTVASFDVGLARHGGHLEHEKSPDATRDNVVGILNIFHGGRPKSLASAG